MIAALVESGPPFQQLGAAHLTVIALTFILPFVLAAFVRRSKWRMVERIIAVLLCLLLAVNYVGYLIYVKRFHAVPFYETLPMQLCDWAMVVIIVALLTGRRAWFELAYFWGIGGTLQALLTPNLPFGWPDLRFVSFFVAHSGIIVGIIFMMLVHRYRPYPSSFLRTVVWTEVYFVVALTLDLLTGVNYGFLLRPPAAASLLSLLSHNWPVYLLEFHVLAWVFFAVLYLPFLIYDLVRGKRLTAKV